MFKENLLKKALRLYAGEHILERVLQQGEMAFSRDVKTTKLTMMSIEASANYTRPEILLTTKQVMDVFNSSIAAVVDCIYRHKGIVDSINGDAIFAYWGLDGKDGHEIKATRCALDCIASLRELSQKNATAALPAVQPRAGINTGSVLVGNIGSDQRIKLSVLGDHVNIASSLTGMCRSYPDTHVLITQFTRERLDNSFSPRFIDSVQIKGRVEPVSLFTF